MTQTDDASEPTSTQNGSQEHRTNWGLFAYIALALVSIALIWALVLQTILVDRSGQTVNKLITALQTSQSDYQHTVDTLQQEADQSRTALQTELNVTRQQTAATISAITSLASASSAGWQDIARAAVTNVSTTSQQAIALLESVLGQVQSRADAAVAAAQTALANARALLARAGSTAADRAAAAAAAAKAALTTAQAAAQRLVNAVQTRLDRIQTAINYIIAHLRPSELVQPAVRDALAHLSSASQFVAAALARLSVITVVTDIVPTIRSLLEKATPDLDKAAALLAALQRQAAPKVPSRSLPTATKAPTVPTPSLPTPGPSPSTPTSSSR